MDRSTLNRYRRMILVHVRGRTCPMTSRFRSFFTISEKYFRLLQHIICARLYIFLLFISISLFHYYFEWTRWFAMMFVFLWISLFIFRFTFCSVFRIYFRNIVQLFWTLKIKLILFQMYQLSNKLLDKKAITNYQIEKVSAKLKYTTTQFKYTTN